MEYYLRGAPSFFFVTMEGFPFNAHLCLPPFPAFLTTNTGYLLRVQTLVIEIVFYDRTYS